MDQSRGQVFVVDDDASFLSAVTRLIVAGGFEAKGVTTVSELCSHFPMPEDSCILADIMLRGESGLDILEALQKYDQLVPLVFMSATDDAAQILAANDAGVSPCLHKPFEAEDLFAALDTALNLQERVYDVACADDRAITSDHQCDGEVGNTVNEGEASYLNNIGDAELRAVWSDPDFDASLRAVYYARVLEIPTPT